MIDLDRLSLAAGRRHGEDDEDTIDAAARAVLEAPRCFVVDLHVDVVDRRWTVTLVGEGPPPTEWPSRVVLVPVVG